uniref:Uncharacterized protein n=1 Tax=Kuenenia stuttgartiensis TaxID=174633 RepID=Q1PVX6_KUEST|nr:unknown protein [Candidatus Kuenenia stuttgartiensis]
MFYNLKSAVNCRIWVQGGLKCLKQFSKC